MAEIRITKQTSVTFYGSFTLGDLRAFIASCDGLPDGSPIRVEHYKGDQRDGSSTSLTVMDAR